MKKIIILLCAFLIISIPACSSHQSQSKVTLNISAAATLTDVINEINVLYNKDRPNVTITANFTSSGTIQSQIENGAPVDIFVSGASLQMDNLQKQGLILPETRKDILSNQIVLIVPNDSNLSIDKFPDLTDSAVRIIAIGEPKSVTAGMYAQKALEELNLYEQIKSKFVLASDVRQVLNYVEVGNADAGFVYATDAKISTKVKVVAIAPEDINAQIIYPVAIIKATKNLEAAKQYETFLTSSAAKEVFSKYGFKLLNWIS
jgi:molybdate transport system substrate-binding protein